MDYSKARFGVRGLVETETAFQHYLVEDGSEHDFSLFAVVEKGEEGEKIVYKSEDYEAAVSECKRRNRKAMSA